MPSVTVIGTQWGDEGKGKIVDWLSAKANIVVRFQGGNNAGHTIQIKNKIYKLSLLPSGIIRGKLCIIGNGVVLDLWALKKEIKSISKLGIKINDKKLMVAENTPLILPIHKIIDEINEKIRGSDSIGTTKKGIGPAYEDKVGRRAIRICDLYDRKELKKKIDDLIKFHNYRNLKFKNKRFNSKEIYNNLIKISGFIKPFTKPVWKILHEATKKNKKILFEGAQGSLLDLDFGTYPFVTSSNTLTGQIYLGTGVNSKYKNYLLGITKAYTTRVGKGPFPTELKNFVGEYLVNQGKEYGTVTGRKRRCGWFDAVLVKQSVILNSLDSIAITKLDVLDELKELKICTHYMYKNKKIDYFPYSQKIQSNLKPIYIKLPGWNKSTAGINKWSDLPKNAKKYLKKIQELVNCKISIVSTSPERDSSILLEKIFNSK